MKAVAVSAQWTLIGPQSIHTFAVVAFGNYGCSAVKLCSIIISELYLYTVPLSLRSAPCVSAELPDNVLLGNESCDVRKLTAQPMRL